jgi:hypothetical protein
MEGWLGSRRPASSAGRISPGNRDSATKESAPREEHSLDRKIVKSYLAVTLALLLCEC